MPVAHPDRRRGCPGRPGTVAEAAVLATRVLPVEQTMTPLELALDRCRASSVSPGPETHQVLLDMVGLSKRLVRHVEDVMAGRVHDWNAIGDEAAQITRACRRERIAALGLDDVGDAGSR